MYGKNFHYLAKVKIYNFIMYLCYINSFNSLILLQAHVFGTISILATYIYTQSQSMYEIYVFID